MKKFIKKYLLVILIVFIVGLVIIPLLVLLGEHYLTGGWFSEAGNDGWLGFWGGFIGSIISFCGSFYIFLETISVQHTENVNMIKNQSKENKIQRDADKEVSFSQARPLFIPTIENVDENSREKTYYSSQNVFICKKSVLRTVINYPIDESGSVDDIFLFRINNVSSKKMMAVKVIINYVNTNDIVNIDLIDASEKSNVAFLSNSSLKVTRITVFYTTELRERIKLVFGVDENMNLDYLKDDKKLENKDGSKVFDNEKIPYESTNFKVSNSIN